MKIKKVLTDTIIEVPLLPSAMFSAIETGRGRSGLRNDGVLTINKGDREKSYIVYCLSVQLL